MTNTTTNKKIPILLTSSVIAHDSGVTLKDTNERIRLALESVEQWLKIEPKLHLVLCDGSSFNFSCIIAEKFPLSEIECLYFENDQNLVEKYGRGYGEGEIVRYATDNSKLIISAGCFAKCTSKLWVDNYIKCLENWNGNLLLKGVFENVFSLFRKTKFSYIDTRFYIVSITTYNKYFKDAHKLIDQKNGHGLENCFFDILLQNKITNCLLKIPPVICGVGGGTGSYYKNPIKRRLKELLRLKFVQKNKKLTPLFSKI